MRTTRHLRGLIGSLFVLPLALAATLMSPRMVSTADGCSGAAPYGAGWMTLEYQGETALPVDGLVRFQGWLSEGTSEKDAVGSVSVTVKDPGGQEVPGGLLLSEGTLLWRSLSPLAPSTTYDISWQVEPGWSFGTPPQGTAQFTTSDASASFPDANFDKVALTRVRRLSGPIATCAYSSFANCGPSTKSFGSEETTPYGVEIEISLPTTTPTYQEIWLERIPTKGALLEDVTPAALFAGSSRTLAARFVDTMETYCVNVVRRDLRDDSEITHEVCVSHQDIPLTSDSLLETQVAACEAPPDLPSLKALWCKSHASEPECVTSTMDPPPLDGYMRDDQSSSSTSGCACTVPAPQRNDPAPHAWIGLGAVAVLLARRRRGYPCAPGLSSPR